MKASLLIKNATQLVTPVSNFNTVQNLPEMGKLKLIENGAVAVIDDKIVAVDTTENVLKKVAITGETIVIDAGGKTVTPGLIDPHTHPVFFETREMEFEWRALGKGYQEIAAAGGGIRSSVRSLRRATKAQLIEVVLPRMKRFLENGVTTIEAKSGYGLSLADEIKSLEVIRAVNRLQPVELVPTFLGAHEIPDEYRENRNEYIRLIIEEMLPRVAEQKLAEFCDVFCEEGVYSLEESRQILLAASRLGLRPKIHANQLTANGAAKLACEVKAISAEHLDHVTPAEIDCMRKTGIIPVLLPSAVFYLNLNQYAPARAMIEAGLPIALSTDFNPGTTMTESLPLIMTIACIKMHLTPAETLIATTLNAALAINRQHLIGSLEVGKQADLVVWNIPNYRHLAYHFGVQLAEFVVKRGQVCYKKSPLSS